MSEMIKEESWVRIVETSMIPPSLKDNRGDADRMIREIAKNLHTQDISHNLHILNSVPAMLRKYGYDIKVALYRDDFSWKIIDIFPRDKRNFYGLAIDLGSTTLVMRLLNLITSETIDQISFTNPQTDIGHDILTRIHFATGEKGLEKLHSSLLEGINHGIGRLARKHGINKKDIIALSAAGNTTMTHFFLGLDPYWICREPYIPVINIPGYAEASDLDLHINPNAPVFTFPNVGSYFGGDLIAGILSSGLHKKKDTSILVDIGTNAEVVLGNHEWLMACAGAAGPALEGGVAKMGMTAGTGVIDRISINPESGKITYATIDGAPPIGLCGSGIIDLIAQLFLAGMIDMRGKYVHTKCGDRIKNQEGIDHFIVVNSSESGSGNDLTLSQPDIDSLLRSKAAMYTILKTITSMVNISFNDLGSFFLAGTFGIYIDPKSAITLGMIPDLPLDIYRPLGNTAIEGAAIALLSDKAINEIKMIRDKVTYVELNVNQEFMNNFSAAKFIPHTDGSFFPSVKVHK